MITGPGSRSVKGAIALVIAAFFFAACYGGPKTDHYAAMLDELRIPAGWTFVKEEADGPGANDRCDPLIAATCPRVWRGYLVQRDPSAVYDEAEAMVKAAGFEISATGYVLCATVSDSTTATCWFEARRGPDDAVFVKIFHSAHEAGLGDAPAGVLGVTVQASRRSPLSPAHS